MAIFALLLRLNRERVRTLLLMGAGAHLDGGWAGESGGSGAGVQSSRIQASTRGAAALSEENITKMVVGRFLGEGDANDASSTSPAPQPPPAAVSPSELTPPPSIGGDAAAPRIALSSSARFLLMEGEFFLLPPPHIASAAPSTGPRNHVLQPPPADPWSPQRAGLSKLAARASYWRPTDSSQGHAAELTLQVVGAPSHASPLPSICPPIASSPHQPSTLLPPLPHFLPP